MLGVSAPTISNRKKRYGGRREGYPRDRSDEIVHLGRKEMDEMMTRSSGATCTSSRSRRTPEGTVKVLCRGRRGARHEEKAALIDARPGTSPRRSSSAPGHPASSSYYYLRSRPERADAYAGPRGHQEEFGAGARGAGGTAGYIRQRGCARGRTPSAYPARR